ncbi:MAG: T9SS type A sorting domain-containing protein [Fibrobacter sp.]|nr:T9SS type A sorting domain-containing protein [Fibrobacter sp.]
MKTAIVIAFGALFGFSVSAGAQNDSARFVFDQDQVFTYKFSFYTPDWADSLEYYKGLPDEPYMPAKMLFYNEKGDTIRIDSVGIRYKGNSSYQFAINSPKKPLKLRFDKYNSKTRFFGLKRLNFSNATMDPSFMREKISLDIARAYMPSPRTAYANIWLEDTQAGFYVQIEQVDKIFLRNYFQDDDGNLYKSSDDGAPLIYRGKDQSAYETEYDLETNNNANDWVPFITMIDKLNNTSALEFISEAGRILDLDNCIRHLAFTMVLSHFDSYTGTGRNFYFYDDPVSGKFSIIPWDLNLAFGGHSNNWNVISMDIADISNLEQRPLNRRILENDSLKRVYYNYLLEMINGPASFDSVSASAARIKTLIEKHVKADPNKFYSDSAFTKNIEEDWQFRDGPVLTRIPGLKSFIQARSESIRSQVAQYSHTLPGGRKSTHDNRIYAGINEQGIHIYHCVNNTDNISIKLYSIQGRMVKSVRQQAGKGQGSNKFTIPGRSFSPGLYTIVIRTEQSSISVPLLVSKTGR